MGLFSSFNERFMFGSFSPHKSNMIKTFVLLALVACAFSSPLPQSFDDQDDYYSDEARYSFEWGVDQDSDESLEFGHRESRDDDVTVGYYFVQLPDGRLQKVNYRVDGDSGFVADVSYEGEARYSNEIGDQGYQK